MPALSFRAKLILSIFPVIVGVTVAVLMIAEKKNSDAQQEIFEEQFEGEIKFLINNRQQRSETTGADLQKLAATPQLISALAQDEQKDAWSLILPEFEKIATDAIARNMRVPGGGAPSSKGLEGPGQRLMERARATAPEIKFDRLPPTSKPFMGVVGHDGDFLKSQRAKIGGKIESELQTDLRLRSGKLRWLQDRKLADILRDQEIGYILVEPPDGKTAQVREIFITPVRESGDTKKFLGALIFGLPMLSRDEQFFFDQSKYTDTTRLMSGVWVEDTLVSTTVPEDQREALAKIIGREIENSAKPSRELTATIGGIRHRIIYRVLNPGSPFPTAAQVTLFSLAAIDRQISELRESVVGLGLGALLIALLLVILLSRNFSGPIHQLVRGTTEIERGNFDFRVPVKSRDEIGRLAQSFNQMAAGLALQEKYRSVLDAVADPGVARELIENSSALGGETREVTMLFCDIRGFTAITESMAPADVIEMLNEHMTALTDVAYKHGGIVDKFVGDLIMVLFGAPRSTGADAANAVRCAIEMLSTRRAMNETSAHPLEIGIGIATGPVVVGCMGSAQRLDYTVLGARVNLASRLCSNAPPGSILIDEQTHAQTAGIAATQPLPPVTMKGFSTPAPCHRILSVD